MHQHTAHSQHLPLQQRVLFVFPTLLAFLMPFGSAVLSWVIVFWTFVALMNYKLFKLQKFTRSIWFWSMPVFFVFTVVSAFFSNTISERGIAIEVKLSFVLFPFLFGGFSYPLDVLKRSAMAFVSGSFFAMIFLLARATYYTLQGESGYFYYTQFAGLMHASYFAMYLLFAISIIMLYYPVWFNKEPQVLKLSYFYLLLFVLGIILCASKLGLICFFLIFPFLVAYRLKDKFSIKKTLLILAGFMVFAGVILLNLPATKERIYNLTHVSSATIDKATTESTAVRVLIWQQCVALIKEKPVLGHGVADANEALYKSYADQGLTGAFTHKFNAHNQYFQTTIGMGVLGLIPLLCFTFFAMIVALIQKHWLLFILCTLFTLNFLVESMLQTAAGVIFVGYMYNFLLSFEYSHLSINHRASIT